MKHWTITSGLLIVLVVVLVAISILVGGLREQPRQDERDELDESVVPVASQEPSVAEPEEPSRLSENLEGSDGASIPVQMLELTDVPTGEFRSQLEKLPKEVQQRVLEKLAKKSPLLSDIDSLRVDSGGMIYYVCSFSAASEDHSEGIPPINDPLPKSAGIELSGALVPISSPPALHSRPGALRVLFLDFNGHVIEDTAWNDDPEFGSVSSWDCLPYDTDGDTTTFSSSELAIMTQAWERVSEDYAPFDVDVTTEQPAVWSRYTGHALITPGEDANGVSCPHDGYGGVAYLDVFGNANYSYNYSGDCHSPAWVIDYGAANAAEAISHELGHNLDLLHDGTSSVEYYSGHVNGSIKWGPIMGTGYYDDVSQWCKGEYYDSNNSEDDLSIIAGKLSYRPDDYGDNNASAALLSTLPTGEVTQEGVVERTGDPDVFYFMMSAGSMSISASTYRAGSGTWGGNLDILLELYDSSGTLVATNNPALEVNASISTTVSAGLYYLHVKPVGVGDPMATTPTGYTSYGSLGQYWITGVVSADGDGDGIPNEWEILHFGGFTNAVATADPDGDGADNLTEYVSGYDPGDSNSVFKVTAFSAPPAGSSPFILTWNPVEGRLYSVGYSDDLSYSVFNGIPGAINLPHTQNSYTDTVERTSPQNFYHVEVRLDQ